MSLYVFDENGIVRRPNFRRIKVGSRAATKGAVIGWSNQKIHGRRETEMIDGVGEVVDGPDEVDRYLIRVKGQKTWVHVESFVVG